MKEVTSAKILLFKNAEIFSPEYLGKKDILCIEGKIIHIGHIEEEHVKALGAEYECIDLEGTMMAPGFIDPHEHFVGGSGEHSFLSRTPEISVLEIIRSGITTVIGCLGVDTVTRTMYTLLAHAKYIKESGLTAYIWSGGYPLPPATLTGEMEKDLLLVTEVIGNGEVALADVRGSELTALEIAKQVAINYSGGILSGKCGVTHFHIGPGKNKMDVLFELLEKYEVNPESIFPTHVNRTVELLKQAAELTRKKITVNMDMADQNLCSSLHKFLEFKGDLKYLTLSTDAAIISPCALLTQLQFVHKELKWSPEKWLPLCTSQTADFLHLKYKGRLEKGRDADLIVFDPKTIQLIYVIGKGKILMRDRNVVFKEDWIKNSTREFSFVGEQDVKNAKFE
jgi:beta-aspartyl-dipeptidase (metallo-type)